MTLSLQNIQRRVRRRMGTYLRPFLPREGEVWDRDAGVTTDAWAEIPDLTVDSDSKVHGHAYGPSPARLVRVILDAIPHDILGECTFVDMGSGRGRVVLMAAERPFRRVRGVEFAAELHSSALENLRRFPAQRLRCDDVAVVLGDAATFPFPPEPLVVYFDNPFSEEILARVLANLAESYRRAPRPVVAVYTQQVREEPQSKTDNIGLLDQQDYLSGRTLRFPLLDRPKLGPFIVRVYSSPEVGSVGGS